MKNLIMLLFLIGGITLAVKGKSMMALKNPHKSTKPKKKGRWKRGSRIQTIIFTRPIWTPKRARAWMRRHKSRYKGQAADITKAEIRFRQESPKHFVKTHYGPKAIPKAYGARWLFGEPKVKYKHWKAK